MATTARVRIWDLPTRLFHWVLAAAVVGSVVSAKIGGNAMVWHVRLGLLVMALLLFRVIWGLVGGHWSRFSSFLPTPGRILTYWRGGPAAQRLSVGHSPLGALSVFGLLALLAVQVGTGLVADDEIAVQGPLYAFVSGAVSSQATGWHKDYGQYGLLLLVALHVVAIAVYAFRGSHLVKPMITGDKELPSSAHSLGSEGPVPISADGAGPRTLAAVIFVAAIGLAAWVSRLG